MLRYSITYHFDLISLSTRDETKRIAVYVANSICLPYLDVRSTCMSMDSMPDGSFYTRSTSISITTCAVGSVIRNEMKINEQHIIIYNQTLHLASPFFFKLNTNIFTYIHTYIQLNL